jgi:tRNA(Ile)-lysidine synthase
MSKLITTVDNFLKPFVDAGNPVFGVAVSGGMDSMALLHACAKMGIPIKVLHVNYQLREKESEGDEQFVRSAAEKLGVPFLLKKVDTKNLKEGSGKSTQMVARDIRYDWFKALIEQGEVDFILLAHHEDDLAETVLLNIIRGTRLAGLHSMRSARGKLLRPMLSLTRSEIAQWMTDNEIAYREDSSNRSTQYKRNRLRLDVLPILREMNPSLSETIHRFSDHMAQLSPLVEEGLRLLKRMSTQEGTTWKIPIERSRLFPGAKYLFHEWALELGIDPPELLWTHLHAEVGAMNVIGDKRILTDREFVIIQEAKAEAVLVEEIPEMEGLWEGAVSLNFRHLDRPPSNLDMGPQVAILDAEKLKWPLTVRPWREGDRFVPFGMTGMKKVQDFFTDLKLDRFEKERVRLLCSGDEIVWLIGLRTDDRFKVADTTEKVYLVQLLSSMK